MEQAGKRLTFHQLFTDEGLSIQIPIIQRDYAQGRKGESEVRTNFLDALFDYLDQNISNRELDFIYGAIGKVDDKQYFIPLDGQQRLTTLFLLHWYLALLSGEMDYLRSILLNEKQMSRFNYETRTSTNEFCNCLLNKNVPYGGFDPLKDISEVIKNEGWFYREWQYDPSVSAMLEMLKAIEKKFSGRPDFWECLLKVNSPIIVFQFLNLDKFDLTDDLYIKMNSRGKPLTPFENFKAKLEQEITKLLPENSLQFKLKLQDGMQEVTPTKYFSHNIDTDWLNHFWNIGGKNPKLVDTQVMNFIRVTLANHSAIAHPPVAGNEIRILFKSQDAKYVDHQKDALSYYSYKALGAISSSTLTGLMNSFENIALAIIETEDTKPDSFHFKASDSLKKVIDHTLSNNDRLLFHAYMGYLIRYPEKLSGLSEWMRVIYNLVENTRTEDASDLSNGLKEIEKLLNDADHILITLSDSNFRFGFFYGRQIEEEKLKAVLILKSERWSQKIHQTEKHNILKGQIGFLFEFSGILKSFAKNSNCNWTCEEEEAYLNRFEDYANKITAILNYLEGRKDEEYLWERAVLTKGDYFIGNSYHRYHLLTTGLVDRDNSWKRLLRLNREIDNTIDIDKKRTYVKHVMDDDRFKAEDVTQSCKKIIMDQTSDWRKYFINNPQLFKFCTKGFIRREIHTDIRLLETTKLTYHHELRTFNLYITSFAGKNFSPLTGLNYVKGYGYEGGSHLCVGEFQKDNCTYFIEIRFAGEDFAIQLRQKEFLVDVSQCPQDLVTVCESLYYLPEGVNGYSIHKETETEVVIAIADLLASLRSIL